MADAAEAIDAIVGEFLQRLERGERADPDEVVRAHPDLAEELRERLAVLVQLDATFGPRAAPKDTGGALVGRRLGPYRLTALLGAGGMGTVYLGTLEEPGAAADAPTQVAVKVVHPRFLARPGGGERFLREAELGRRVRHANVVRTLDVGAADCDGATLRYLVMEHVEGRTLRDLADESGRVPEQLCRHVGREIARGLAALHAAGAVHRDLKPDNVLITPDHVVKVMDLGVARLRDEAARLSQTGTFVGSLLYGAPEQFGRAGKIDGRADLHALGVLLHELATGEHPFAGDDLRVVVRRVLDERPRRLGVIHPQISPFFEELVAQLLEKDPDRRPASADEVAQVLDEGEASAWWRSRAVAIRRETRRPLRRIRIPRETALHGRDAEVAKLRALFDRAKSGDGQVVLVEGEAGIGKSRLVDEFVLSLWAAGEDIDFLVGSYPPGGAATASGAFSTAYCAHLGDDEAAIRDALPQTPLLIPAFAALLRGDAPPEGAEKLTKDSIQTLFVHATRSFAARRTTIVFIDDLHFAPEEGRALFASLALATPGHRILLVGGARRSLDEKWAAGFARLPNASRLPLERLSPKDVVDLLDDALHSRHVAEELAGKIASKSDGNPFFVFEILRGLREGNFLTRKSDGTWITTRVIREIEVPPSIVEVIQARVSDLGVDDRNVLEVAACLGFEFDGALVGAVLGIQLIPLLQRLGRIEKVHRLVRAVGYRFAFDHHQMQEVLYAGLSAPLREAYHAAIAEAIEQRSGAASRDPKDLDGALCADLAEHFLRGAKGEPALRYLDAALTHLEMSYLNDAAVRLADRALAVPELVAGTDRCELLLRKADRLELLGRRDATPAAIEEACSLADAVGDGVLRGRTLRFLGAHLWLTARYDEAQTVLRGALDAAHCAGDRREEIRAAGYLGNVLWSLGRFSDAQAQYERNVSRAREIGDRWQEVISTGNLGTVLCSLGRYSEAQAHLEPGLAHAREIGNRRGEVNVTGNLGNVLCSLGRFSEAQAHLERHLTLAREIGDRAEEAVALVNLGPLRLVLGDVPDGRRRLESSLALCREIGERYPEGYALRGLADAADEEGDAEGALRLAEAALALRREIGHGDGVGESLLQVANLHHRSGDVDAARAALDEALALSHAQGRAAATAHAAALLACLPRGDSAAAVDALAAARETPEVRNAAAIRFLLWQATRDCAHLVEAKRLLDFMVEHAPPECREPMLANVRLHREILAAWRDESERGGAPFVA